MNPHVSSLVPMIIPSNYGKINPGHKAVFQHGFPVEAVLAIPYSDLVAVAGGTLVKVWSLRKSNEPLFEVNIHNKSVTSMTTNSSGSRLLTGSIDQFVRVFRFQQGGNSNKAMENVHAFSVPSGVLSLSMSKNDKRIAIGTIKHGLITRGRGSGMEDFERWIQQQHYENDPIAKYDDDYKEFMTEGEKRRYMTEPQAEGKEKYIRYGSRDWVLRGQNLKIPDRISTKDLKPHTTSLQVDNVGWNLTVVRKKKFRKYKNYDRALRQFEYKKALNIALESKDILTVHSVLEELWRRDGLDIAFGGRNSMELKPLLQYLIYSLGHPHLTQTALHCTALLIDSYQSIVGLSSDTDYLFEKLADIIDHQVAVHKILLKVQGSVDMILSAQDIAANPVPQRMLNLRDQINDMMQKTKAMYESKRGDDGTQSVSPESMDTD